MEIWIATGNKGKLNEFRVLLNRLGDFVAAADPTSSEASSLVIKSSADLPVFSPPPENGKTYIENARIKARSLKAMKPQTWVFGEDTGLEVTALGLLPGLHSARYAGPKAQDSENRAKLLKMLSIKGALDRSAAFRAVLVAYTPEGEEWSFEGVMTGTIAKSEKGAMGFGYDSIFVPTGQTQTLAELDPGFKNRESHRAKVIHEFLAKFQATYLNK